MNENIVLDLILKIERFSRVALTGSINNVLSAVIDEVNSLPRTPAQAGYSLGLGAPGETFDQAAPLMGELCTAPGCIGVLTAGDENKTVVVQGSESRFWTPFNVSLGDDFEEVYTFECYKPSPIGELYTAIFDIAAQNAEYRGLAAVSMFMEIDSFFGSLIKTSPLRGSVDGGKIIDPGLFENWFGVDKKPVYDGHTAVSVGIGLDMTFDEPFPKKMLDRIFYVHPANIGKSDRILHNHSFILPPDLLPEEIDDYNSAVAAALNPENVLDIKHILDNTTLRRGYIALNYVRKIGDL